MMHPIIPGANVKLQRHSKTNNIGNIVSKMDEVLHSVVTHDINLWLHLLKNTVALTEGRISAQPHTIVKQSSKPKGNLLFSSLFPLSKDCMYDEIWGCCAEIMPISNLKIKKKEYFEMLA